MFGIVVEVVDIRELLQRELCRVYYAVDPRLAQVMQE